MTVEELIAICRDLPPDTPVFSYDDEYALVQPTESVTVEAIHEVLVLDERHPPETYTQLGRTRAPLSHKGKVARTFVALVLNSPSNR